MRGRDNTGTRKSTEGRSASASIVWPAPAFTYLMRLPLAIAVSLFLHLFLLLYFAQPFFPDRYRETQKVPLSVVLPGQVVSSRINITGTNVSAASGTNFAEYYSSSAVDVRASPIVIKPLIIPPLAYMARQRGVVRLRAYIDELGYVRRVDILSATPAGVYEQVAIEAVTGTIFSPARRGGAAVKTYKNLEINIDPYETISVP